MIMIPYDRWQFNKNESLFVNLPKIINAEILFEDNYKINQLIHKKKLLL